MKNTEKTKQNMTKVDKENICACESNGLGRLGTSFQTYLKRILSLH